MEEGITVFTTVHVCGNGVLSPSDGGTFGLPRSFVKWQKKEKRIKKKKGRRKKVLCVRVCTPAVCVGV